MNKLSKAHALSRRMKFRGLDISIETDKGEKRHWKCEHSGEEGSTLMKLPYGYIRRTEGVDGDHLDVYVGPKEDAEFVYVVHQMKAPNFKTFDEDKVMLGLDSEEAARKAYLDHYNDKRFLGSITKMPWAEFEKKAKKSFEDPKKIAGWFDPRPKDVTYKNIIHALIVPAALEALGRISGLVGSNIETYKYHTGLLAKDKRALGTVENRTEPLRHIEPELRRQLNTPANTQVTYPLPKDDWWTAWTGGHHDINPETGAHEIKIPGRTSAPSALAHELAHAEGKQIPLTRASTHFGTVGSVAGLLAGGLLNPYNTAAKVAPLAVTLPMIPRLLEESRANISAYRALKNLGHGRSALWGLLPAAGASLATAISPGLTAELMRRTRMKTSEEQLIGGKADGQPASKYDPKQLALGMKVEREHTADPEKQLEITEDHLEETGGRKSKYYTALDTMEKQLMKNAYALGMKQAMQTLLKTADRALGDPNFWAPETPPTPPPPANIEEALQTLPGQSFQGLQIKIGPDGTKETKVQLTPDVLQSPDSMQTLFQTSPEAKLEISSPEYANTRAGKSKDAVGPGAVGAGGAPGQPAGAVDGEQQPQQVGAQGAPMGDAMKMGSLSRVLQKMALSKSGADSIQNIHKKRTNSQDEDIARYLARNIRGGKDSPFSTHKTADAWADYQKNNPQPAKQPETPKQTQAPTPPVPPQQTPKETRFSVGGTGANTWGEAGAAMRIR